MKRSHSQSIPGEAFPVFLMRRSIATKSGHGGDGVRYPFDPAPVLANLLAQLHSICGKSDVTEEALEV